MEGMTQNTPRNEDIAKMGDNNGQSKLCCKCYVQNTSGYNHRKLFDLQSYLFWQYPVDNLPGKISPKKKQPQLIK